MVLIAIYCKHIHYMFPFAQNMEPLLGDIRQILQKQRGKVILATPHTSAVWGAEKLSTVMIQSCFARAVCCECHRIGLSAVSLLICDLNSGMFLETIFRCKYIPLKPLFLTSNPLNSIPMDLDMMLCWHFQLLSKLNSSSTCSKLYSLA